MNKDNPLNENIRKVLDILELRFDIGIRPNTPIFSVGKKKDKAFLFEDDYKGEKLRAGIWMSDINDAGLSVESCWDILSILTTKIDDFEIVRKFKTGYKNERYESLASKVDEPPPIFEVLLPSNFLNISQKIKNISSIKSKTDHQSLKNSEIREMGLLEDKTETKRITVYININYNQPLIFNRKDYWSKMYELAKTQEVSYDKGFFDYFNSNKVNPLYKQNAFKITKLLKKEYDSIKPEIPIKLVTRKKVAQRLNSA